MKRSQSTESRQPKYAARLSKLLQASRLFVLGCVVWLIHSQHQELLSETQARTDYEQLMPILQEVLPDARSLQPRRIEDGTGLLAIESSHGEQIGWGARTSPISDRIIGFSGPTDVLLIFDMQQRLLRASVLSSRDTRDHVRRVLASPLLEELRGKELEQLRSTRPVDGVSGATLTSLAIIESIHHRLQPAQASESDRGEPASLKFPSLVRMQDVRVLFPEAESIAFDAKLQLWRVQDGRHNLLGHLQRSSPASDNVVGYQGPTDSLIALDAAGRVIGIAVGESYDNEPYVDYVRTDRYFRKLFNGQTLEELAYLDWDASQIEGVSGATMTSRAVAKGIVTSASVQLERQTTADLIPAQTPMRPTLFNPTTRRDISTIGLALLGVVFAFTRWKRTRWLRILFQFLLIGWLGLVNGDLLSQAMWVGWAQSGVPLNNALGLVCLTGVALILPITTGKNVYCAHICPHGAVQQLVRNRLPSRWRIPPRIETILRWLPASLLAWVLVVAILHLPLSLVDIEPFDAWLWPIAGIAALSVAIVGLVASLFIPMAYCRYGCPTGKLLDYLRATSHGRWTRRDTAGFVLLSVAVALTFFA
ncbi:MAG: FMN-binding protein [Pirellulaceae bacterium]|jgi:NosR/NirI family nitrous oxide reductase transcriptional regulator